MGGTDWWDAEELAEQIRHPQRGTKAMAEIGIAMSGREPTVPDTPLVKAIAKFLIQNSNTLDGPEAPIYPAARAIAAAAGKSIRSAMLSEGAVEAAAMRYFADDFDGGLIIDTLRQEYLWTQDWSGKPSDADKEECRATARAVITAALDKAGL